MIVQATWAELEGGPDEHHRRAGRAPSPDHLRLGGPRQRRDPPGSHRARDQGRAARLAGQAAQRRGRVRGGGLHRLAVCGRGTPGSRVGRPPGRAGRDQQPAWPQAAGQDRPGRRPAAAGAAGAGPAAQLLDPAGLDLGPAHHRAAAQEAGRPSHRLAAAHPRRAVPPRAAPPHPGAAGRGQPRLAGAGGAAAGQPAAAWGRAAPDRWAGCRAGPDRPLAGCGPWPVASRAAGRS
jgi:hypothetical protein